MITQKQIENATPWELQGLLESFQRDADHAREWVKKVEEGTKTIKVALCLKINGEHKFKDGVCGCGAVHDEE